MYPNLKAIAYFLMGAGFWTAVNVFLSNRSGLSTIFACLACAIASTSMFMAFLLMAVKFP